MNKTFYKKEKKKYLQEIDLFNNYPNYVLPINKSYETNNKYIIEYNNYQTLSTTINKEQIDKLILFIKILHQEGIHLDYLSQQTVFINENTILFSINNKHFEHVNFNQSIYLDQSLYSENYESKNDIYILGIFIYQNYYNKLPNFNKLCKTNKKPYFKFNNVNYFSSYINRIIELCVYQKKDYNLIFDDILKDKINKNITHRLYFTDEVCNALYFSMYEGKLKDALYWSSELFGVGEYNLIIKILIKLLILKIGILYQGIFEYTYKNLNNFNKNHNRNKKEIFINLITSFSNCNKNSIVENLIYISYQNLVNDDLKLNINIRNIFTLFEIDLFKMIKILILQNREDFIWNYLSRNGYHNYKYLYFLKKYDPNSIYLAVLDFHRNQYKFKIYPTSVINNNTLKYFGYNIRRNKNEILTQYLNLDTKRGNHDIIRKTVYYGLDRCNEFKNLNIINYFNEEQIIFNYGYKIFSMKQVYDINEYKKIYEFKLDNDYSEQYFKYLMEIEDNSNFIFTNNEYIKTRLLNTNKCKVDQYNLVILDTG